MIHREISLSGRVLHVGGELDMTTCGVLERAVLDAAGALDDPTRVYVSFESCSYLDSSTIAVLVRLQQTLGERLFVVADASSRAYRLLRLCGLLDYLHVIASVPDLRGATRAPQREYLFVPAAGHRKG